MDNSGEPWCARHSQIMARLAAKGAPGILRRRVFAILTSGRFALNEVNTIPGFTDISMFPKLMQHSGYEFDVLVDKMIDFAIASTPVSGKTPSRQIVETVA